MSSAMSYLNYFWGKPYPVPAYPMPKELLLIKEYNPIQEFLDKMPRKMVCKLQNPLHENGDYYLIIEHCSIYAGTLKELYKLAKSYIYLRKKNLIIQSNTGWNQSRKIVNDDYLFQSNDLNITDILKKYLAFSLFSKQVLKKYPEAKLTYKIRNIKVGFVYSLNIKNVNFFHADLNKLKDIFKKLHKYNSKSLDITKQLNFYYIFLIDNKLSFFEKRVKSFLKKNELSDATQLQLNL